LRTFSSSRWTSPFPPDDAKPPFIRAREVVRVAESIGFVFDRQRGSHAVYYRPGDGRRVVTPMHGPKDLKPGTLRGIIIDIGLGIEEFTSRL
jgi:predicted RNA binding protein YcfA (HicA-like mRNA interferase family)